MSLPTQAEFDEAYYLQMNPDVAAHVPGTFSSGYHHFSSGGHREPRAWRRVGAAVPAPTPPPVVPQPPSPGTPQPPVAAQPPAEGVGGLLSLAMSPGPLGLPWAVWAVGAWFFLKK